MSGCASPLALQVASSLAAVLGAELWEDSDFACGPGAWLWQPRGAARCGRPVTQNRVQNKGSAVSKLAHGQSPVGQKRGKANQAQARCEGPKAALPHIAKAGLVTYEPDWLAVLAHPQKHR